jgi:hypothetical protein
VSSLGTPEQADQHGSPTPRTSLSLSPSLSLTGTAFDADEDLVSCSSAVVDGRTYYYYELYSLAGNKHSVTAVTTKVRGAAHV